MIDLMKDKRISTAPMIDWTTKHYLTFARWFNPYIFLYTEMISTSAILQGNTEYLLSFYDNQHPVVLQLGGSNPHDLATCAKIGEKYGYDEINLNVGCPSDRVQHYKIGACLMAEPNLVADCIKAMQDSVCIPITVKHRIGIDSFDSYEFMRDFVGRVAESGCKHFIAHARIALLNGLSPKENREIPPLRYDDVYRLKREFPDIFIEINGGIKTLDDVQNHLNHLDGVMIGREAYHNPMFLGELMRLWGQKPPTHREIFEQLLLFLADCEKQGTPLTLIMRHYLGLFQGLAGSRKWRQALSGQKSISIEQVKIAGEAVLNCIEP